MSEKLENIYLKRLAEIVAIAPKVGNSYIYMTPIKINNPERNTSLLETKLT